MFDLDYVHQEAPWKNIQSWFLQLCLSIEHVPDFNYHRLAFLTMGFEYATQKAVQNMNIFMMAAYQIATTTFSEHAIFHRQKVKKGPNRASMWKWAKTKRKIHNLWVEKVIRQYSWLGASGSRLTLLSVCKQKSQRDR